jgi:hypothetical protein
MGGVFGFGLGEDPQTNILFDPLTLFTATFHIVLIDPAWPAMTPNQRERAK